MKIGWKVMRRVGGRLASALAGSQSYPGGSYRYRGDRVYYYVRTATMASWRKPLAVFTDRRDALQWAADWGRDHRGLEVWDCSYKPCDAPKWVGGMFRGPPPNTDFATRIRLGRRDAAVCVSGVGDR